MTAKRISLICFLALVTCAASWTAAQEKSSQPQMQSAMATSNSPASTGAAVRSTGTTSPAKVESPVKNDAAARLEGERRFRANCGRCHVAPQKFPPRMMATIVRHMRVRATITDQDMRLILQYMSQ